MRRRKEKGKELGEEEEKYHCENRWNERATIDENVKKPMIMKGK